MKGLFNKYKIEKADGSPIDPKAVYFVLRLDTDPHARAALFEYMKSVSRDNPELANQIRDKYGPSLLCRTEIEYLSQDPMVSKWYWNDWLCEEHIGPFESKTEAQADYSKVRLGREVTEAKERI
jgi:hypothetical protein